MADDETDEVIENVWGDILQIITRWVRPKNSPINAQIRPAKGKIVLVIEQLHPESRVSTTTTVVMDNDLAKEISRRLKIVVEHNEKE